MVRVTGHGGVQALAAARRYGVTTLFTLSGGHIFPLYDAAAKEGQPLRMVDVRHEQTAVFAAEATARLTRTPGLAALILNIAIAVILTLVLKATRVPEGADETLPQQYTADPAQAPAPVPAGAGVGGVGIGTAGAAGD